MALLAAPAHEIHVAYAREAKPMTDACSVPALPPATRSRLGAILALAEGEANPAEAKASA